jgi:undecaprenyl-diphosphatase
MDPIQALDNGAYYYFRDQRKAGIELLDRCMPALSNLGSSWFLGILGIFVVVGLLRRRNARGALAFLGSVLAASALVLAVRLIVGRPRPDEAGAAGISSFGFPSETAALSCLLFGVLGLVLAGDFRRPRHQALVNCLAVLPILAIGASQLYMGYSFLTDVLAGWAAGALLVLLGDRLGWYSSRRGFQPM